MITWMQRHKKWLVITIWISTIAFVGAGFVGWGSYDYGSKGGTVALVGDREVSLDEYQREYSKLYEQYSSIFKEQFNQEMADKLKLKEAAYKLLIQKNLILSYADELGLDITDEEVARQVIQIPAFIKDGKFDKDTYIKVLNQNRTNPTDFEASLKRDLLLQKVQNIFNVNAQKSELKFLNEVLFSEDEVSIKILKRDNIKVNITEKQVKEYWEKNKNNYKSEPKLELAYEEVAISDKSFSETEIAEYYKNFRTDFKNKDGKIKSLNEARSDINLALNKKASKKTALKKYLKLKKGKENFTNKKSIVESKLAYGMEENKAISSASVNEVLKPFLFGGEYIIVKVLNKIPSKTLDFEEAKVLAKADYKVVAKNKELEKIANEQLKNFKGENLGYISRDSFDKIKGLSGQEAVAFLNQLFSSSTKSGKIAVGNKVVLYKINGSRLASYDSSKDKMVKGTIDNLLSRELMDNLVKNLENRYEIKSEIKFEE